MRCQRLGQAPPLPQDPRVTLTCSNPSDADAYFTVLEDTMYADLVDVVRRQRLQFLIPLDPMPLYPKIEH
jgi:hypothetical protein